MDQKHGKTRCSVEAYPCILPRHPGLISSLMVKMRLSRIKLRREQTDIIRSLPSAALVVYVMKQKSRLAHLFFHIQYGRLGLPCPEVALNDSIIIGQPLGWLLKIARHHLTHLCRRYRLPNPHREEILSAYLINGRAAILYLAGHRDFLKRFMGRQKDPLQMLIRLQERIQAPIYLVPQVFIYGKRPDSSGKKVLRAIFGSPQSPGGLRKLFFLLFRSEMPIAEISEPVNLKSVLKFFDAEGVAPADRSSLLRRSLMDQLNRHLRSVTGPVLKSPEELKQTILTHPDLAAFMEKYAKRRRLPLHRVRREAVVYLDEIAAKYRPHVVAAGIRIVRWLLRQMFDGVSVNAEGLSEVKRSARRGPIIFMPCHRSHFDYFILPYVLYKHNMPWPHIFAGKNLSFFPIGLLFRSVGAFFVRRSFAGAVFYTKVFSAYIHMLLKEGYNIKVYIEGGRSRTGKLLPPKLGMINILLNAYLRGACGELTFVPVYVGYDRVPEETAYIEESAGASKHRESALQMLKAGKVLKKRYGRIFIRFDRPFPLTSLLKSSGSTGRGPSMDAKTQNTLCRAIGYRAVSAIDRVCVVTPQGLVAGAILNTSRRFITPAHILYQVRTYLFHLCFQDVELAASLRRDHENAVQHIIKDFLRRKLIEQTFRGADARHVESVYRIVADKRAALEYYKNGCISFFIPAAYTAISILEMDVLQFPGTDIMAGYRFLSRLFSLEFPQYTDHAAARQVRKTVKAFIDDGMLLPHPTLPDTYRITSPGLRKLRFYGRFLVTFMESYQVVLTYLGRYPRNAHSKEVRIKKIHALGKRLFKDRVILRKEALSGMYYTNALEYFFRNGIRGEEDKGRIRETHTRLSRLIALLP